MMEALITNDRKPRSGLYTLQFGYVPMESSTPPVSSRSGDDDVDSNEHHGVGGDDEDLSALVAAAAAAATATTAPPAGKKKSATANGSSKTTANGPPKGAGGGDGSTVCDVPPPSSGTTATTVDGSDAAEGVVGSGSGAPADASGLNDDLGEEVRRRAIHKACATTYGPWTLLCRLRFEGDVLGRIKGSVKVQTPAGGPSSASSLPPSPTKKESGNTTGVAPPSVVAGEPTVSGATPTASPAHAAPAASPCSSPAVGSSGTRVCIQHESMWKPSDEVRLVLSVDRLDGSVVGCASDLTNVTIRCHGHVSDGWYVGGATVTQAQSTGAPERPARKLRFLLKYYNGPRCTRCLDPVGSEPLTCTGCGCAQFCSPRCLEAHAGGHAAICGALRGFSGPHAGRAAASFAGVDFTVFWRCVKGCSFEVVVDHHNPMGQAYEMQLNPLKDAREGLDYAFLGPKVEGGGESATPTLDTASPSAALEGIAPSPSPPSDQALNELNVSVFFAVAESTRDAGALLLTAACLNHLFTFCPDVDNIVPTYYQFYDVYVRDQFEGTRNISCLGEYVAIVRTTFELGQTLLEWALRAPFASLFWQRLVAAKDVLVSLFNFNSSLQFSSTIQNAKQVLVSDQQRQTLHLLARVFIVMASRAPKELAQRLLIRAEECFKDSVDEDRTQNNYREMAATMFKMAALATLYEHPSERARAASLKSDAMKVLALAERPPSLVHTAAAANHQPTL